jgi:predicted TIM-barrel fold metal-dependent hydrolase
MGYNGHVVIDSDCHIREYWDLDRTYKDYIDPEYREKYEQFSTAVRAKQPVRGDVGLNHVLWPMPPSHPMGIYDAFTAPTRQRSNGGFASNRAITGKGIEIDNSCNWDPAVRLRDMDTAGIDISVMFASQSDGYCMLNEVGFESALQRAYHRFMSNYCSEADGRLWWIANSNLRDIAETVSQLKEWTEHDQYFAGMFIPRACPDGSMLDNPILHPLFAASQELDMPIWVHGGSNRPPLTPWPGASNAVYHGWGGQYAMSGLIGGGVFDLFPRLRIGLFESGGGWMPWLVEKLDDGYKPGSAMNPLMKRTPSEVVASGQLYCSIEADEGQLEHAVEDLGEDIWLFTTDYPHPGTPWPDGVPMITERPGLTESAKIKMLGDNALRFLPRLVGVKAAR